jgi:glycine betaine/choline ABC-type transport system substrate-binding protein
MKRRSARILLPLAVVGALLSACGESASTLTTQPTVAPRVAVTSVKGDDTSALLAAIYARLLEQAGFRVARKDPVELDRAGYYAALQAGEFQLIPDFSGDLMAFLYSQPGAPTAPTTIVPSEPATTQAPITIPVATTPPTTVVGDTTPVTQAPITAAPTTTLPEPVVNGRTTAAQIKAIRAALASTAAIDDGLIAERKVVIACTEATMTANQNSQLFTLTNLASIAPKIRIGASAAFLADTEAGFPALQQFYGGDWAGTVTVEQAGLADAIEKGTADCFAVDSLDPIVTSKKLTIITDDKAMVPSNAAVALLASSVATPDLIAAIDTLIASLTTTRLNQMLVQVASGTAPSVVADAFMATI